MLVVFSLSSAFMKNCMREVGNEKVTKQVHVSVRENVNALLREREREGERNSESERERERVEKMRFIISRVTKSE